VFQTKVLAFGKVTILGHAMAQVVSWWPLTTEVQVCAQVSPYGIYGGQSIAETGISLNCLVFPCQYHSTVALQTHISSGGYAIGSVVAAVQRHSLTPSI
jgi:hypothetical protein